MNGWFKALLIALLGLLYGAYWAFMFKIEGVDILHMAYSFNSLPFSLSAIFMPVYFVLFIVNWRKLDHVDFSFIYMQLVIGVLVFFFTGVFSIIYTIPCMFVISGLYLISFFASVRESIWTKHVVGFWLFVLVAIFIMSLTQPVFP
jgi:hypothetical protein